ncbi:Carbohydrate-binding WSCsubgroup [Penicillium lividum]|nr:Carbohydrate-binding WSCsubgroup [Penicillium lividum]
MHFSLLVSVALAVLPRTFATSSLAYCATENTGASSNSSSYTYQSNGHCTGLCDDYAFGVLLDYECWCSNVAPASDTEKKHAECDSECPGYPDDSCGNSTLGVYAYVSVTGNMATSTASDSSSSTTTGTSSSTITTAATVAYTTSSDGEVKTITVSGSSATSGLDSTTVSTSDKSSGLSGGSIAGIVVGVLGGLALVAALIFLVFFYRKRARSSSPVPSQDMADRTSQGSNWSRGVFPGGDLGRKATFTDNRMKSTTVYPDGRRDSSVSLQDNEDYSRPVLRLTNPD